MGAGKGNDAGFAGNGGAAEADGKSHGGGPERTDLPYGQAGSPRGDAEHTDVWSGDDGARCGGPEQGDVAHRRSAAAALHGQEQGKVKNE